MSPRKKLMKDYDPEFRQRAIKLIKSEKMSTANVAKDLDIPIGTLYNWLDKFNKGIWKLDDRPIRAGVQSNSQYSAGETRTQGRLPSSSQKLHDRLSDMERKNKELEIQLKRTMQERDILKKAMAYCLEVPK